jgi:nitroimidazol reductase NimA-like FMN-containing flavoprotein (pyridoxamine 5'-phosphate oxidase superfamily)
MAADSNPYDNKARIIIERSNYMVIGTSTKNGKPWTAPVLFVHDTSFNIYFLSAVDSLHAENILDDPNVSISIFDSHQRVGSYEGGVQAEGKAKPVGKNDIERVIRLYCKKLFPDSDIEPTERYVPDNYLGVAEFRFFQIKLDNVYVTGEERRVKVELGKN